jgi:hypothetical protein
MQHGKTAGACGWLPAVQKHWRFGGWFLALAVEETDLTRLVKQLMFSVLDAWATNFGASSNAMKRSNRFQLSPRSRVHHGLRERTQLIA